MPPEGLPQARSHGASYSSRGRCASMQRRAPPGELSGRQACPRRGGPHGRIHSKVRRSRCWLKKRKKKSRMPVFAKKTLRLQQQRQLRQQRQQRRIASGDRLASGSSNDGSGTAAAQQREQQRKQKRKQQSESAWAQIRYCSSRNPQIDLPLRRIRFGQISIRIFANINLIKGKPKSEL